MAAQGPVEEAGHLSAPRLIAHSSLARIAHELGRDLHDTVHVLFSPKPANKPDRADAEASLLRVRASLLRAFR